MNASRNILKADMDPVWLLRIFTVIPVVLILIAGGGVIWIYFFVMSLLPQGQSVVEIPGLTADVRVVRDSHGVPGIIGDNEEDLAHVLGYVMAQDRLWQMDYFRRAGRGTLAEILGRDYLESDHIMRTVTAGTQDAYSTARLGDRERKWVERFVRGINAYLAAHTLKPPVEFSLLEYRPRPFTPDDVMSIVRALAWYSSPAAEIDPVMASLPAKLGKERALDIFPTDPAASAPFVVSDLLGWTPEGGMFSRSGGSPLPFRFPGLRGGSAWAVGPGRSRSGKPLVASAVYQVLTAPGFWYRARMAAGAFRLSGSFIPGVPVALAGTNGKVGWGSTLAYADDADLYMERFDADDASHYWRVDRPKRIREINETYRVRGRSKTSRSIRLTGTGPLVSDVVAGKALSLRWTAREGLGVIEAFFGVNRATGGNEARSALKSLVAPCLNVVWGDDDGNFGIQTAGLIPIRPQGSDGIVPMPAWTGTYDWLGYIPFEELPAENNPAEGIAVVADGRPGGNTYPYFVSCYWNDGGRQSRIESLLKNDGGHSRESFQKILGDTGSPLAGSLTPEILKAFEGRAPGDKTRQDALRILASWDQKMTRDSPAAAVFGLAYQSLLEEMFRAPMGEDLYARFAGNPNLAGRAVKKIILGGAESWLGKEGSLSLLRRSFEKAVSEGSGLMGNDPSKWAWGRIHSAEFRHPLTSRSRFLEALYHVGPVPLKGSGDTIDFAGWYPSHPFTVTAGVSLTQIADMTDPPQVFGISPMGVSAHFFSSHYKDLTGVWLQGRSFRDPVETADIRKGGFSQVLFKARPSGALSMK
ncbi:MAG: penicillin acylase family protein [Pseudomonadota bacterium]